MAFRDWLDCVQMKFAEAQMGLPYRFTLTENQEKQLSSGLRSSNAEDLRIVEPLIGGKAYDVALIMIRAAQGHPTTIASIEPTQNLMDLCPLYYKELRKSLRDLSIVIGKTSLRNADCNVVTLLHETSTREVAWSRQIIHFGTSSQKLM